MTGPTGKVMLMPEEKADTDYIMVATGTGIAPYRGFIRRLFTETTPAGEAYKGLAWLFLGVANSDALLYDEEWQAAKSKFPDNFRVDYALSREEKNKKGGKMYIQDKVEEYADEIFERLQNGAVMYFCGLKGMMPGTISASRCVEVPSRHRRDSCPSHDDVGGFFSDFEPVIAGPRPEGILGISRRPARRALRLRAVPRGVDGGEQLAARPLGDGHGVHGAHVRVQCPLASRRWRLGGLFFDFEHAGSTRTTPSYSGVNASRTSRRYSRRATTSSSSATTRRRRTRAAGRSRSMKITKD